MSPTSLQVDRRTLGALERRGMGTFRRINGHTIFAAGLGADVTVVDLGASRGRFSDLMRADFPGSYHAVEANPALASLLKERLFASVQACAVAGTRAPVPFHIAKNDEGSTLLRLPAQSELGGTKVATVEVDGVPLPEILRASVPDGVIDLVKVDIEGAELVAIPCLGPADLARISQLSVEFHSDEAFGFGHTEATRATIDVLARQGFLVLEFAPSHIDVLFINRALHRISFAQELRWRALAAAHRWPTTVRKFVGRRRRALSTNYR